jgi:hypothetical protein
MTQGGTVFPVRVVKYSVAGHRDVKSLYKMFMSKIINKIKMSLNFGHVTM